jgi:uncharacterized protein (UPF0147 family)
MIGKHSLSGCDALTLAKPILNVKKRGSKVMPKELKDVQNNIESIAELMESVIEDHSVPRNIRAAVEEAKKTILEATEDVALSKAIYILDDISNDVNLPPHSRTDLWTIISELEALKENLG